MFVHRDTCYLGATCLDVIVGRVQRISRGEILLLGFQRSKTESMFSHLIRLTYDKCPRYGIAGTFADADVL